MFLIIALKVSPSSVAPSASTPDRKSGISASFLGVARELYRDMKNLHLTLGS